MFTLAPKDRFTYPVNVETITNGGAIRKDKFTVTFKRLSTEDVTQRIALIVAASGEGVEVSVQNARDLAHEVVLDWQDVLDDQGVPVPFSSEALTQALNIHPVPSAIATAWIEAVNGGAKRKNS